MIDFQIGFQIGVLELLNNKSSSFFHLANIMAVY